MGNVLEIHCPANCSERHIDRDLREGDGVARLCSLTAVCARPVWCATLTRHRSGERIQSTRMRPEFVIASRTHMLARRLGLIPAGALIVTACDRDRRGSRSQRCSCRGSRCRSSPRRFPNDSENIGAPDRTRTCDPRLRRPVLYPTELRARASIVTDPRTPSGWSRRHTAINGPGHHAPSGSG